MIRMKKLFRDQWLDALRSGVYTQGFNRLVREESNGTTSYCCLGVACDILHHTTQYLWKLDNSKSWSFEGQYITLPEVVWPSIFVNTPPKMIQDFLRSLIIFNDKFYYSFDQIADYIEQHTVGV